MEIYKGKDQTVAQWSGGTTTQLAIWPKDAVYAERNFVWRLSTATVDEEESIFTSLPDYQRFLGVRHGELLLNHGDHNWQYITPRKVAVFDGGAPTRSRGKVTDMNLMIRKDVEEGAMQSILVTPEAKGRRLREFMDVREAVQGSELELCPPKREKSLENGDIFAIYHSAGADIVLQLPESEGGEQIRLESGDLAVWNLADEWKYVRVIDCEDAHIFGFWVMKR